MTLKTIFNFRLCIYGLFLVDIAFAVFSFLNDYSSLAILIYAIVSALMYMVLFSIDNNSSKQENKFYAVISWISLFLFTFITFGPYLGFTGFIAVPTITYALFAYTYYRLRNKYEQTDLIIFFNTLFMIIKVGLIFALIVAISLPGGV